ncbi:MAG: hypothetical protein MI919_16760, partial [Holophagales bacterium]|nr:hypothetical protein [Holophagales bacterium]
MQERKRKPSRTRGKGPASRDSSRGPADSPRSSGRLGAHYARGPAVSLGGGGVQAKVAVGKPGDRYEKEADGAAEKVEKGQKVSEISRLPPGGLGKAQRTPAEGAEEPAQSKEEEPAQETSVQRQEEEPAQEASEDDAVQSKEEEPAQSKEEEPAQETSVQRQEEKPAQESSD